ncbi:MAG: glycosyltransferase family 4 protein [Sterolibacteriaceae bacterium MAG5]|nr:glycosyltransferase family 4 protein [Candidatus Nitricoxidireducens bremensis]
MKIAIARQKYTPYGGAERFVERALGGLREQGVEVTMIAREWTGDAAGVLRCDPFYLGRTWRDAGFARCVRGVIDSGRFDLVQSHERIPGCHVYRAGDGVHATWLELRDAARGGLARLATRLSPWHRYTLAAEAAMFRDPALRGVICNSVMVRDDIVRRFGVAADKLHVIHNGVDLDHFHPGLRDEHRVKARAELGIPESAPVVLFVGSGFERKGVHVLLRALAAMKRQNAHLVVVGKDRGAKLAEQVSQTLGVDERVHFLGGLKDVRPWYGAADVFCLPTLYDPMPNAALEALACGLPVATSTTCGAAELIAPGRNGTVCGALDIPALAAALDALLGPDGMATRREAARASVTGLSTASMAGKLADFYRRMGPPVA